VTGADPLAGAVWEVLDVGGDPVPGPGPRPWLAFGPGRRMAGHAGVNRVAGPYSVTGGVLRVEPLIATRMAGPRARMALEERLLGVLSRPVPAEVEGEDLVLRDPDDPVRLRRRPEQAPPPGPSA
jgi:heat shock protein HslJ